MKGVDINDDYGVALFGKENLRFYMPDTLDGRPNLGAKDRPFFAMPLSDAAPLDTPASVAIETGFAPSAMKAWKEGGDIYGVAFPIKDIDTRLPTKEDAMGWRHFLEGGHTAINVEGTSTFFVNKTREFVLPGGNPMPEKSVLFSLDSNGSWMPLWRY